MSLTKCFPTIVWLVLTLILLGVTVAKAKTFTRCELAKTLLKYKFPKSQLGDWVCLVEASSGRNTATMSKINSNGSRDYGLFLINSLYWCAGGAGWKYNECDISCKALIDDDISDDIKCVQKIYGRHGFSAWTGWEKKCKGKDVSSYIANCKL